MNLEHSEIQHFITLSSFLYYSLIPLIHSSNQMMAKLLDSAGLLVIFQSYKLKVTLSLESKVVIYINVQSFTFTNCCLEWIIFKEI